MLVTQPVHDYRKRRAIELLSELPLASLHDMQRMQYDVVSLQARELLGVFLPYLPDGDLKQRLQQWDHRYNPESRDATLFLKLYRNVMFELLGNEQGIGWRRMLYLCTRVGYSMMTTRGRDQSPSRISRLPPRTRP